MSEQRPDEGDWGETQLDPQEQRDAEINLDDPTDSDNEPWSPPERQPRPAELAEVDGEETLDQRLRQEVPDETVGEEERLGGDDPDSIPADQDVAGGSAPDVHGEGPEGSALHVEP